jgi:hypothetical protein
MLLRTCERQKLLDTGNIKRAIVILEAIVTVPLVRTNVVGVRNRIILWVIIRISVGCTIRVLRVGTGVP